MYTVYDRMYGYFPAKNAVYTPYVCMVLANPNSKSRGVAAGQPRTPLPGGFDPVTFKSLVVQNDNGPLGLQGSSPNPNPARQFQYGHFRGFYHPN
jgi:hypothetical protein